MALPKYTLFGETIVLPVAFVPVVPYGVEFAANGSPVQQVGDSYRLDLQLSVRPKLDSGFIGKLTKRIGDVLTFRCPQIRDTAITSGVMRVNGNHDAGDDQIAVDGVTTALEGDRIVKFANHTGIYLTVATGTETRLNIFPPLTDDVTDNDIVLYDNGHASLSYSGVFSGDISSRLTLLRKSNYMQTYTLAFHEAR